MNIVIDGKNLEATEGQMILEVATNAGISIPTLCNNKSILPYASCFICVVEIKGLKKLVPSCATRVTNGMVIETNSKRVRDARKMCLDLLLSDHVGDCRGPCEVTCPANIDIPGFISLLAHNQEAEALRLIKEKLPFPASLGRVCPRPCETDCRRMCSSNEPVAICFLKRHIADTDLFSPSPYIPKTGVPTGKGVAIVGAGPSGLTAAFYLRQAGHEVRIFDAHAEPGGMLRYGIPAYRLPRDVLAKEIGIIQKMGARIECNKRLGVDFTIESLKKDYDAVFLAIGAQSASEMRVDGERDGGAISGIEFLDTIASGKKVDIGNDVIIVGGGNTAIDAARTSLRLGAKNVTILYRRTRKEMPANNFEIEAALEEGVVIKFLAAPIKMAKTEKHIELTCIEMKLGEPDSSGRRRPVPVEGSEYIIKASAVISAIGQSVDAECLEAEVNDLKLTKWDTLEVDNDTYKTNLDGIFAGGDCVTGADTAVTAIAAGRKAASSIDQYLTGLSVKGEVNRYLHNISKHPEGVPAEIKAVLTPDPYARSKMPELDAKNRIQSFDEVETGFTEEQAIKEANRCLSCGCRSFESCSLRRLAMEYGADADRLAGNKRQFHIDTSHDKIVYESHKCIMCASCVRVCSEVEKMDALGYVGRGFYSTIKPTLARPWKESTCNSCLKCVPLCPTGAISLKVTPAEEVIGKRTKQKDVSKDIS